MVKEYIFLVATCEEPQLARGLLSEELADTEVTSEGRDEIVNKLDELASARSREWLSKVTPDEHRYLISQLTTNDLRVHINFYREELSEEDVLQKRAINALFYLADTLRFAAA